MSEKMNVYQKLATARVNLQKLDIKKSGENKFAKFNYFELTDVLPHINEIFNKLGLVSAYSFMSEYATLKIIDTETGETIEFQIATSIDDIGARMGEDKQSRGMQPVQRLGSVVTYTKRYLYFNALEISESDTVDSMDNSQSNNGTKQNNNTNQSTQQTKPNDRKFVIEDFNKSYKAIDNGGDKQKKMAVKELFANENLLNEEKEIDKEKFKKLPLNKLKMLTVELIKIETREV